MKNNKIYGLLAVALTLSVSSCKDKDIEIVESDPTYAIDKDAVYVDIPEEFKYNDDNIIRYNGAAEVQFALQVGGSGQVTAINEAAALHFKLRRPLTKPVRITLEEDLSLLDSYTGNKSGYSELPEGVFGNLTFEIPTGQVETSVNLTLQNYSQLTNSPGYLTAYRIKVAEGTEDVAFSEGAASLYVKINAAGALVEDLTNANIVSSFPTEWSKVSTSLLTASTNMEDVDDGWGQSVGVYALVDGSVNEVYQGDPVEEPIYIQVNFLKSTSVNGFVFRSTRSYVENFGVQSFEVWASADSGQTWRKQGVVRGADQHGANLHVKFNIPVEVNALRFHNLEVVENSWGYIALTEIEAYTN